MRDGRIKVEVRDLKVHSVSINSGMDLVYERLFKKALKNVNDGSEEIDNRVSLILFGCFWIEAVCNEYLRELLQSTLKPQLVGATVWDALKRQSWHWKYRCLLSFDERISDEEAKKFCGDLQRIFDLRNRLVHFKDEDELLTSNTPVEGERTSDPNISEKELTPEDEQCDENVVSSSDAERPRSLLPAMTDFSLVVPDTKLIQYLTSPMFELLAQAIEASKNKLDDVYSKYEKRTEIPIHPADLAIKDGQSQSS